MKDDPFTMFMDVVMGILFLGLVVSLAEMNVNWIVGCVSLLIAMHPVAKRCGVFE